MKRRNGTTIPTPARPAATGRARFRFRYAHILLVLSGMLLMAVMQQVVTRAPKSSAEPPRAGAKPMPQPVSQANSARWGTLEYVPIALERPQNYFTKEIERAQTKWVFPNFTEAQMADLFQSLELGAAAKSFLTNGKNWDRLAEGFGITPPAVVVLDIPSASRARLYEVLARAPQNLTYRSPFILRANNFDQWFSNCGLSREKVEQVRKLTYPQGDLLFFADLPAFTELSTPAENLCLVRSLWRVSTFIMSVRVTPGMDSESLLNYWAKGGRAYSYKPLVDSMARLGNGTAINISYFLPPFARLRLYTFPQPEEPHTMREDCFWTAMNFFNDQPDDRYFNPEATIRAINSDYVRVKEGDREFGDVLLLLSKESQALHMCVYIADDVVFTKNGFNVMQPYVLMKLDEMLAWYANEKPFNVVTYRRRALAHTGAAGLSMTRQNQ